MRQYPALHLCVVVQLGIGEQIQHRAGGTCFGVQGTKNHAFKARLQHGADTHGTRLKRYKKLAIVQAVVAQSQCCCTERHNFSVGCRIAATNGRIVANGNHLPIPNDHRAYRYFTSGQGNQRLPQRKRHESGVINRHLCQRPGRPQCTLARIIPTQWWRVACC